MKKQIISIFKNLLICFIIVTSLFGTFGIYNFIRVGIYDNPKIIFTSGGLYATVENFRSIFQSIELEEVAVNLTKNCENDYDKVRIIYQTLINFRFKEGSELNPYNNWKDKECDCDECSYLFMSLLKNLNIKSMMQCNNIHCWLIVKLQDRKILADVGKMRWKEYEK